MAEKTRRHKFFTYINLVFQYKKKKLKKSFGECTHCIFAKAERNTSHSSHIIIIIIIIIAFLLLVTVECFFYVHIFEL